MKASIDMKKLVGGKHARGCVTPHEGAYLTHLVQTYRPEVTVEIGSWIGISTIYLGQAIKDLGSGCFLVSIDPHSSTSSHIRQGVEDTEILLKENLRRFELEEVVHIKRMTSLEALGTWDGTFIDLLFLDGCLLSIHEDFAGWAPFVPTGGLVVFHDYPDRPGVLRAVDNFVRASNLWEEIGQEQKIIAFRRRVT